MNLVYEKTIVEALAPVDITGAAHDGNYISMKGYDHCTIIINTGAWAGGTSAVTVNRATAVAGTGEDAGGVEFDYMWTNDGAVALSALTKTAVTADTFNLDTANSMYVIEIPAASIKGSSTTEYDCIQLALATPGANADLCSATYILSKGRYKSDTPIEPLTD
jgi:hypothetical protein